MSQVYYRIDDRLIHGQVVTSWSRYYQLKQIIIIDAEVAKDPIQQQIITLVAPSDIKVSIKDATEGAQFIKDAASKDISTLVLVKGPESLVELTEQNVSVDKVVVGGMQFKNGRKKITKTVSVTQAESESFKRLVDIEAKLIYQVIPTDKQQNFSHMLGIFSRGEV